MHHKPIKAGLASFGMSSQVFHAPLITAHTGFELAAVVERHSSLALKTYPNVRIHRTVDDLLRDEEVEFVVINTPNDYHFDMTRQALEKGKHVIVEKPFTNTVTEGEGLLKIAESADRVLSVFQNRRWDSDFLTVKKIIQSQSLGRIVAYEAHFDRYRTYLESDTWKEDQGPGSGIVYNLGSHLIDQALVLFGFPDWLWATLSQVRSGSRVDDYFDIFMKSGGIHILLRASYLVKKPGPRYLVHGEKGSFLKYGIDLQEEALKAGLIPGSENWGMEPPEQWGTLTTAGEEADRDEKIASVPGDYLSYYDNIYDAVRRHKPLAVPAFDGLQVIRVIEAVYKSHEEKRIVTF